jgi:hypothetical protein
MTALASSEDLTGLRVLVAVLCSRAADFITGQTLDVDGGATSKPASGIGPGTLSPSHEEEKGNVGARSGQ